jgi:hypothetical protein
VFVVTGAVGVACSANRSESVAQARSSGVARGALLALDGLTVSDELSVAAPVYEPRQIDPTRPSFGTDSYLIGTYWVGPLVMRVDRSGKVLDPFGIELAAVRSSSAIPGYNTGTAFDGTNWISIWAEQTSADTSTTHSFLCARVQADGTALDPGGVLLVSNAADQPLPPVFDGNQFLSLGDNFVFVDRSCHMLNSVPSPLRRSAVSAVAFDGQHYLVLYSDRSNVTDPFSFYVQPFSTAGSPVGDPYSIDTIQPPPLTDPGNPARFGADLGIHAGAAGVVYSFCDGKNFSVRFRSISVDGKVGSAQTLLLTSSSPVITAVDDGFMVADALNIEHITADGAEIAAMALETLPSVLGSDGTSVLEAGRNGVYLIDHGLTSTTSAPLFEIAAERRSPGVAATADTGLVAFYLDSAQVGAVRFTKSGTRVDDQPLALATDAGGPVVASNGTGFFAAWPKDSVYGIEGRTVSTSGELGPLVELGPSDTIVPRADPRMASDGRDYFVVWELDREIVGMRVSGDGSAIDTTPLSLADIPGGTPGHAVAFDGHHYFLAVGDQSMGSHAAGPIRIVLVEPDTGDFSVTTLPWTGLVEGVAWAGDEGLLLWAPASGDPITASRIDATGAALEPTGVSMGSSWADLDGGNLVWNGSLYLVARNEPMTGAAWLHRITKAGVLLDPDGIPLAPGDAVQLTQDFSLASFGGDSLVAYSRYDGTPEFRSMQARVRLLTGTGLPSAQVGQAGEAGEAGAAGSGGAPGESVGGSSSGAVGGSGDTAGRGGNPTGAAGSNGGRAQGARGGSGGAAGGTSLGGGSAAGGKGGAGGSAAAHAGRSGASSGAGGRATGGSSGAAHGGENGTPNQPGTDTGCGCRLATHDSTSGAPALGVLLLFALRRRRAATQATRAALAQGRACALSSSSAPL